MPLMACSTAPPRPCQKVRCRSFSVTRAGSSARSPMRNGRSSLHRRRRRALAGEDAADADEALVGEDLDDGVDVVLGLEFLGPAALDGAAGKSREPQFGNCHHSLPSGRWASPRDRHGRAPGWHGGGAVVADVLRAVLPPRHVAHELLHRLLVRLPALLGRREFRVAENAGVGVAARPRDDRRGPGREEIDPVERAVLLVEADRRRS